MRGLPEGAWRCLPRRLDLGANIAAHTIAIACPRPQGLVLAVGPDPGNRGHLSRSVKVNGLTNVTVVAAAIGKEERTATLQISDEHPGSAFVATTNARDQRSVKVPATTVDVLVQHEGLDRVDVVTLDIESPKTETIAGDRDVEP